MRDMSGAATSLNASLNAWAQATLRLIATILLVLLAVNTVAILLLNAAYDWSLHPTARTLWRPIVYRNAIFAVPCFLLLYFVRNRRGPGAAPALSARVTWLYRKLIAAALVLGLIVGVLAQIADVAENVIFYRTVSLTRTPGQTLNLLYLVLWAAVGLYVYLRRPKARAKPPK